MAGLNAMRTWKEKLGLLRRPLTLSEKILYAHLVNPEQDLERGSSELALHPKRLALHDANAQLALLQFISTSLPRVQIPTSVHTDHLITARHGAAADLEEAKLVNEEVYKFLQSACDKYGIAYWRPGAGILHQIIFEQYAYPGGFMLGTDSHTPNAAGLGMLAIGCGGMEGVDVMAGAAYEIKHPNVIGVELTGKLGGWTSAKGMSGVLKRFNGRKMRTDGLIGTVDVILKLASILTVKGATNHIIEYYGAGLSSLSATGMATIGNMGAEVGATSSIFPYTRSMGEYLRLTGREGIARAAETGGGLYLRRDAGASYDRHIQIDLNDLEPHVNGPFTPDLSHSISTLSTAAEENPSWPTDLSAALIGSCTNSSYEDFTRAASLIKQASEAGLVPKVPLLVAPGSEEIRATLDRDGVLDVFTHDAGGKLLANACGACVGQWERADVVKGQQNNSLSLPNGEAFQFASPTGDIWPEQGYQRSLELYQPPKDAGSKVQLEIDPRSERIQLIAPFEPWGGEDEQVVETLIKVKGKCTTDHISAAGPWYKYRGHLQNISGDDNYGEGSSREIAAMSPRYMGCFAVIAKSMARIHEMNLKKQGILALYFRNPTDYDKISGTDTVSIHGLAAFAPGRDLEAEIMKESGVVERIPLSHTFTARQIGYFQAGSALNVLASHKGKGTV
ncbi:hypothetical protein QFC24_003429 [Naganishia onofrii]|uniref:Uncharacterized protein n=1 Tax=Naganishia onofrii TaxID=1851511 RepID=A0ACC2XIK4_9TREE|nr:hypothetical protein QFC24_003429 [Naganishia onofrii]